MGKNGKKVFVFPKMSTTKKFTSNTFMLVVPDFPGIVPGTPFILLAFEFLLYALAFLHPLASE